MAYLLHDESGAVAAAHDRRAMGHFPRAVWPDPIAAAGFRPMAGPFAHSSHVGTGPEVFLGPRPGP